MGKKHKNSIANINYARPPGSLSRLAEEYFGQPPPNALQGVTVCNNIPMDLILDIGQELVTGIESKPGVFLGLETDSGKGYYAGKPANKEGNLLTLGISGSGKSSVVSKSVVETCSDPVVVFDIKGELAAHYETLFDKGEVKRPYIVFNPDEPNNCYDVYALLKEDDRSFVPYVREISNAIIPKPLIDPNAYWVDMARDMLSAAIIFFFKQDFGFIETMIAIQTTPMKKIVATIKEHGCEKTRMFISEAGSIKREHLASIATEIKRHTMVFATDESIQAALDSDKSEAAKTFSWDDVAKSDEPINVFLCVPQDKLEQWGGVIRVMLTQLIHVLERRPEKFSTEGQQYPPVLILLDEFPMLGRMDIISSAMTTLRSKNVSFFLMVQSLPQMDYAYGYETRRIIFDNCQYKIILRVTEPDTQKYLSELFGTVRTGTRSISENYDPYTQRSTYGWQIQEAREPLIRPEEFSFNDDILLHTPLGIFRTIKLPVWVSKLHCNDFDKIVRLYFEKGSGKALEVIMENYAKLRNRIVPWDGRWSYKT